jgi:hypothetical protein
MTSVEFYSSLSGLVRNFKSSSRGNYLSIKDFKYFISSEIALNRECEIPISSLRAILGDREYILPILNSYPSIIVNSTLFIKDIPENILTSQIGLLFKRMSSVTGSDGIILARQDTEHRMYYCNRDFAMDNEHNLLILYTITGKFVPNGSSILQFIATGVNVHISNSIYFNKDNEEFNKIVLKKVIPYYSEYKFDRFNINKSTNTIFDNSWGDDAATHIIIEDLNKYIHKSPIIDASHDSKQLCNTSQLYNNIMYPSEVTDNSNNDQGGVF